MEEKAKENAAILAATEKLKREAASSLFFKSIEIGLGDEMMKANPELLKHGLLSGPKMGGITMDPKRFETQIRVTYGRAAFCEVNFDQGNSTVLIEMTLDQGADKPAPPQKLAFRVGYTNSGPVAGKVEGDQEPSGRFGAEEIAQIVIAGIIRGYFE